MYATIVVLAFLAGHLTPPAPVKPAVPRYGIPRGEFARDVSRYAHLCRPPEPPCYDDSK